MLSLGNIIRKNNINFHCYVDNTQFYLSLKPNDTNSLSNLQACLKDIKIWMTCTFLLLNSDKTEVTVLGPKHLRSTLPYDIVIQDNIILASSTTVRNLGVIFDQDLFFYSHIKEISRTAFFHIRNMQKLGLVFLRKMQRNWSMHLLPPDWTIVTPYYQAALRSF